jgi:hypothetical protein
MELGGAPQVGGDVPVSLRIRSFIEVASVKIQVTLPKGVELVSGQDAWEGELTAGSLKEMTFILKIKESGRYVVRARAMIQSQGGFKMAKGTSLVIDLGTDSSLGVESKQKIKPKRKTPIIRKGKDGQDIGEFPLD